MDTQQDIAKELGQLDVSIIDEKKSSKLKVVGKFPTNGEKPIFSLQKNDPQGFNPSILLLTLLFGGVVREGGTGSAIAEYSETLATRDQYSSVQVVAPDGRTLAMAVVNQ